jgi:hypothetical protein
MRHAFLTFELREYKGFGTQNAASRHGLRPEISLPLYCTISGKQKAAWPRSHYSFVFEDSLSTRPVQDRHRKIYFPSEKQHLSL